MAVKLSTGEPPASNYLDPQLIMYSTALGGTALVIRILSCSVCGGGTIPLIREWLVMGMSMGSASAFMITGPATKITNLGALKIVLGVKRFILYIAYVMAYSLVTGLIVNLIL